MSLALDRALSIVEHLVGHPQGLPISLIASELDIPLGACHRLLADLQRHDVQMIIIYHFGNSIQISALAICKIPYIKGTDSDSAHTSS